MSKPVLRPLSLLVDLVTDRTLARKDLSKAYVGLEHIPSSGSTLMHVGSAQESVSTNGIFREGDILFGKLRPRLRKSVRVRISGYCSTDVLVLRPRSDVDHAFAGYVAQSDAVFVRAIQTEEGTKMPRCSWKDLKAVKVFAPIDTGVQQRIAAVLARVDEAIERTGELIEKHQHIKAGLMQDLFMCGVLASGELRQQLDAAPSLYREGPAGVIPAEWEVATAGSLCSLVTKGTTPAAADMWEGDEGIRFLRVDNLTFDGQLSFGASEFRIAPFTHASTLARSRCGAGDVLMNIVGPPLGKVGLVSEEDGGININQAIAVFRPGGRVLSRFLLLWLTTDTAKRWILQRGKQTSGQVNVTLAMCQALPVPLPTLEEQSRIVARISPSDSTLRLLAMRLEKVRAQKLGLMQDLLTGKVAVKVPEPAIPA